MVLWLVTAAWGTPCDAPVSQSQIGDRADAMLTAFASFDEDAFGPARDRLFLDIGCVSEPLDAAVAAKVHLAAGIAHFTSGDRALARAGIDAAYQVDASVWIDGLVPSAHPLEVMWREAADLARVSEPVPVPVDGALWWDGSKGRERPSNRATVGQHVVDDEVRFTAWLPPGEPLPRYEAKAERSPQAANRLALGGVGLAVVGGGLYGAAALSRARFDTYDPSVPFESRTEWAQQQQQRTNRLVVASGALGAVGLGTVVVSRAF